MTNSYVDNSCAAIALKSMGDAVICTDTEGKITFLNSAAEKVTGWKYSDAAGKALGLVFHVINPVTRLADLDIVRLVLQRNRTVRLPSNTIMIKRDGSEIVVEDSSAPILNEAAQQCGVVIVFRDVSISQAWANKMAHLAQHDALTGLPNRAVLSDRLSQAMKMSIRNASQFALLFIDLDNFKPINDNFSHSVGDRVLVEVASRLKLCVRDTDTVSRTGGDEFVILMAELDDLASVTRVAETILTTLSAPYLVNRKKHRISASIGISIYPENGSDAETLMNNADTAMYQAKNSGGNTYQLAQGKTE